MFRCQLAGVSGGARSSFVGDDALVGVLGIVHVRRVHDLDLHGHHAYCAASSSAHSQG